jgi:hypothetical protein
MNLGARPSPVAIAKPLTGVNRESTRMNTDQCPNTVPLWERGPLARIFPWYTFTFLSRPLSGRRTEPKSLRVLMDAATRGTRRG